MDQCVPEYFLCENNRKIAWLERGDPKGFPIFYAHGNPGSRLELMFLDKKARQYGIRLIVFERPGLGQSDYIKRYSLLAFAKDLEKIADEKGINKFGLMGWSSGGPPVLAAAYYMPDRVQFVFSIAGYTNFGECADSKGLMEKYHLHGPWLSENNHTLFDTLVAVVRWTDIHLPNFYLKMAKGDMKASDRLILNNPAIADLFMRDQEEALFLGTKGAIQDLEIQWATWEFSLKDINVPVHIFQGKQDVFVPWQFAEHLAANIPNSTLHLYEDRGHLFPLWPDYQDDLFRLIRFLIK